jgi:hypothetical protein
MNATRRKLTKTRKQVGDLMLHTLIVEAHCKKLYGGEHWPHEQFLFVWELVRNWNEDRYGAAALAVVDDLQHRGIYIERFDDQQNGDD